MRPALKDKAQGAPIDRSEPVRRVRLSGSIRTGRSLPVRVVEPGLKQRQPPRSRSRACGARRFASSDRSIRTPAASDGAASRSTAGDHKEA